MSSHDIDGSPSDRFSLLPVVRSYFNTFPVCPIYMTLLLLGSAAIHALVNLAGTLEPLELLTITVSNVLPLSVERMMVWFVFITNNVGLSPSRVMAKSRAPTPAPVTSTVLAEILTVFRPKSSIRNNDCSLLPCL